MNITVERTESSKVKYELEKAIQFNKLLLKDISYPSFLFDVIGSYLDIHLITFVHLITKYEKEKILLYFKERLLDRLIKYIYQW